MLNNINFTPAKCGYNHQKGLKRGILNFTQLNNQAGNDTVNISTKSYKPNKGALILSGLGVLALETILAVKKAGRGSSYIEKAQKMFKEAFISDDISVNETKAILKRYKEIENCMKERFKPEFVKMVEDMGYGKTEIPKGENISNMISKFFEAHDNYTDPTGIISMYKYHNNFLEKDARKIGKGMQNLLKNIPHID